jgi:hypothetical protein
MFAAIIAVILVLALMFLCGRYTAKVAARRGRSKVTWFLLGSLLFPVSSLILALLPSHGETRAA